MKLSEWARKQGIAYQTAWRWYKTGQLPVAAVQTSSGTILVTEETTRVLPTVVYARVSSAQKKDDLDRQASRCVDFCTSRGWEVTKVVREVASGMNDGRKKLHRILTTGPARLVVEHKDRLTRFGFKYFEALLPQLGWELIVVNRDLEEKDDLLKDLVAVITSFCCRLYGMRRGHAQARRAREVIEETSCDAPAK